METPEELKAEEEARGRDLTIEPKDCMCFPEKAKDILTMALSDVIVDIEQLKIKASGREKDYQDYRLKNYLYVLGQIKAVPVCLKEDESTEADRRSEMQVEDGRT